MQGFQLRRINPFQGLMIDAAVWRDAHEYHRDHMRLHNLALHGWGIVNGLGISQEGRENTLLIEPGIGIDPAGNFIVVVEPHVHRIESRGAGTVYLVLQFREVPDGPTQSGLDGVGPRTHILEAYQVQERDRLPKDAYLELARVDYDPSRGPIALPADPQHPGPNELDLRFRVPLGGATRAEELRLPSQRRADQLLAAPREGRSGVLEVGLGVHAGPGWDQHLSGLRSLAHELEAAIGRSVRTVDALALSEADRAEVVYLAGHGPLGLGAPELTGLRRLVDQGGLVVAEGCADGPAGEAGAEEFKASFNDLARKLGRFPVEVKRGHPLLVAWHHFAQPPLACRASARVVADAGLVYCEADYGCAWQGGPMDRPLSRGTIRDALEFGVNLALYRPAGP